MKHSKVSSDGDGGGGGGSIITATSQGKSQRQNDFLAIRPTRTEKLYNATIAIYIYPDGSVEIGKNRNGDHGRVTIEKAIYYFSKILAEMKLKNTKLDMFKKGLSELLREEITKTLEGDYHERTICSEST